MTGFFKKPSWVAAIQRWALILLAWSLPVSLFGMQLGMIIGAVGVLAWGIRTRFAGFRSPLDAAFLALLAAVGLSLLMAPRGAESFRAATSFWVWLTFFVVYHGLDSQKTLRWAVHGLLILAVAAAAFGIFQTFTGLYPLGDIIHSGVVTQLEPIKGEPGRFTAVGFFTTRVTFAHMLLFPFCWLAALALQPLRGRVRLLLLAGLVVVGIGMVCTWRRTAPVAGLVALLGLLWVRIRAGRLRWIVTGLAAAALIGALVMLAPGLVQRLQKSFLGGGDWGRMTIVQTALDMASERPTTGFGFGNFEREARPRIEKRLAAMGRTRFSGRLTWAHNDLLTFWAECGILGALAFCFLFVAWFLAVRRGIRRIPDDDHWLRGFVHGSVAAVAVFLATGMFHDHFFHGAELGFVLWFTLGASLAAVREPGRLCELLRVGHFAVMLGLFLLSTLINFPPKEGVAGWWPAGVAGLLLLVGLYLTLKHRRPWSRMRRESILAVVVLLVLSAATAGLFRGVLAFRSSGEIAPGSVDFLLVALVWTAAGFGLDACLRRVHDRFFKLR